MSKAADQVSLRVNELLHKEFEIPMEKLVPEAKLYEDLALDSLDAVDMLVHLEATLGVKVVGEKFMYVRRLADVYEVIAEVVTQTNNSMVTPTNTTPPSDLSSNTPNT